MSIKSLNDIKHIFYINLKHRTDRKEHVETELHKLGMTAERFDAIQTQNGAIGCSMSHLKILENAKKNKLGHVLILEDDIVFLDPQLFKNQLNKFFNIHNNNWDVVLFAGNNMPPYETIDDTCVKVSACQTTTGYLVNGHYINILISNIRMGLNNLLHNPSATAIFAIDKFWFVLQKTCNWYLIIPLTVVQQDGYSDIEKTNVSYKKIMQDLDKTKLIRFLNTKTNNQQC